MDTDEVQKTCLAHSTHHCLMLVSRSEAKMVSLPCTMVLKMLNLNDPEWRAREPRFGDSAPRASFMYNTCLVPEGSGVCHADPVTPSVLHFNKEETEGPGGLVQGHTQ